ncbi:DNase1 protein [Sodiomyces alkalinus F11]|uniref:DNase1 protein n=1 Tax=Sodiomyces alkalinus (strain CBS 110278 / VKM F-3762 / F11) TaxID=1314773 RepID=A0A3N2PXU7_SODAK|nr:DNase1 protein [Sodiomyces alkalinus F11]ROT39236.1 DNase1 protein [Sodiomyces alkalinus F11]
MKFTQTLSLLGFAALAAAVKLTNTVTFISLDDTERTVYFTPSEGHEEIDSVKIAGGDNITTKIPEGWIGNWYSVSAGKPNVPGMLGEVAFQGWNDLTYFDVSAIVDPNDKDGVKEMYPVESQDPSSGCQDFPCNNAYYVWDDVQTKVTPETDLVCTLGSGVSPLKSHKAKSVKRDFVLGKF